MEVRPPAARVQGRAPRATRPRASLPRSPAPLLAALPLLGALFFAAPPLAARPAGDAPARARVGVIELAAPDRASYVVRATLPVPRGTYHEDDALSPFGVVDADGSVVPAQTEVVSRWPRNEDGADVVEILARVSKPAVPQGDRVRYDVVLQPHVEGPLQVHPDPAGLLAKPRKIRLKAWDVFGNAYSAELLNASLPRVVLRDGAVVHELRTHATLQPTPDVAGPRGTLPHLFGVHAYFRVHAHEPVLQVDLRLHNGQSGLERATDELAQPLDRFYFRKIELWVPRAFGVWQAFEDTTSGPLRTEGRWSVYPLVTERDDGRPHVMPRQAQFVRRLAIARLEREEEAEFVLEDRGLAFCRPADDGSGGLAWSWWNPDTARYFPQRQPLPDLSHVGYEGMRRDASTDLHILRGHVASGTAAGFPVISGALGWAHPWGIDHGGMAGGTEIFLFEGLRAACAGSWAEVRRLALKHRMNTDRHPTALFDLDGEPTRAESWLAEGPFGTYQSAWMFLVPLLFAADPFGFGESPTFQRDYVAANGLQPDYEATLLAHQPLDFEHFVRYTGPAKALVWLANDALAKDDLLLQAELFRMSYQELPTEPYGYVAGTQLAADMKYVHMNPGLGFVFGRLEGWGLDCALAAYSTQDEEWRRTVRPWIDRIVRVVERGQSTCSGIIQASVYEQFFGGQYRTRQSIEQAIVENAFMSALHTVYEDVDPGIAQRVEGILERSLYAMIRPPAWSFEANGPWNKLAVGDSDFTHPPFCGSTPPDGVADGPDGFQTWCSFAYGFRLTGDLLFLERAAQMAGGGGLLQSLEGDGLHNIENKAALLALLQGH